jgi:peptidoglycan/LPS O-acetylase OafA/YrhL
MNSTSPSVGARSTTQPAPAAPFGSADADIARGVRLGYRPELDGLRAVAVIAVVTHHLLPRLKGGFLGVDLFFLLSGFLITRLLLEERHRNGRVELGAFYVRRAARLLPALIVVCLATLTVAALGLGPSLGEAGKATLFALGYGVNWAHVFGALVPLFGARPPLEQLWSLSVEEQFYLIWPLLLIVLASWGGTRWARRAGAIVIATSAVQMLVRFQRGVDFDVLYQGTDGQGAVFLMSGCLLAMLVAVDPVSLARSVAGRVARLAMLPATTVLLFMVVAVPREQPFFFGGGYIVVAALMDVVVITALCGGPVSRGLRIGPLVWVGRLSYGMYLWHIPIRDWFGAAVPELGVHATAVITVALTVVCAIASYRFVEMPLRAWAGTKLAGRSRSLRIGWADSQAHDDTAARNHLDERVLRRQPWDGRLGATPCRHAGAD